MAIWSIVRYEKNDTQNLAHSISEGTHQVIAQVSENGTSVSL